MRLRVSRRWEGTYLKWVTNQLLSGMLLQVAYICIYVYMYICIYVYCDLSTPVIPWCDSSVGCACRCSCCFLSRLEHQWREGRGFRLLDNLWTLWAIVPGKTSCGVWWTGFPLSLTLTLLDRVPYWLLGFDLFRWLDHPFCFQGSQLATSVFSHW